jgi:hypothetical protein
MRTIPSGPPIAYSISFGWNARLEGPAKKGERREEWLWLWLMGTVNLLSTEGFSTGGREWTIMFCGRDVEVVADVLPERVSYNESACEPSYSRRKHCCLGVHRKIGQCIAMRLPLFAQQTDSISISQIPQPHFAIDTAIHLVYPSPVQSQQLT